MRIRPPSALSQGAALGALPVIQPLGSSKVQAEGVGGSHRDPCLCPSQLGNLLGTSVPSPRNRNENTFSQGLNPLHPAGMWDLPPGFLSAFSPFPCNPLSQSPVPQDILSLLGVWVTQKLGSKGFPSWRGH